MAFQQQPGPQQPMDAQAQAALGAPVGQGQAAGKWRHGAFECHDCNTCVWSHFLPCFQYSLNRSKLKHLEEGRLNDEPRICGIDSLVWCAGFWTCLYWIPQMLTRARLRERHGIHGSLCNDFWLSLCCPCPELAQESFEIEDEIQGKAAAVHQSFGI